MAEPTLTQVFGANALQDANTVTIDKADLTGLTPQAENTAESLLAALMLKAGSYLTTTNQTSNADQSITIEEGLGNITTDGNTNYRTYSYTVTFRKIDTQTTIDPDDF